MQNKCQEIIFNGEGHSDTIICSLVSGLLQRMKKIMQKGLINHCIISVFTTILLNSDALN